MEKPPQEYPVDLKQRIKSGLGKLIMAISYGGAPYMGWIPRGSDFPAPPQQDYPSYEEEVFEYDECDWTPAIEYQEVEIMNLGMLALNKRLSVLDKRDRRALNSDVFNLDIMDTLAKKTEIKPTLRDKRHLRLLLKKDFIAEDLDLQLENLYLGYVEYMPG